MADCCFIFNLLRSLIKLNIECIMTQKKLSIKKIMTLNYIVLKLLGH